MKNRRNWFLCILLLFWLLCSAALILDTARWIAAQAPKPAAPFVIDTQPSAEDAKPLPLMLKKGSNGLQNAVAEIVPPTETQTAEPVTEPAPTVKERYIGICMTAEERELLAKVVYLEAGAEPLQSQQAVAEVVLNRVKHADFPDSVADVLWQPGQFSVMGALSLAEVSQTQYDAIDAALYDESILPEDVVYFALGAINDRIWGYLGAVCFCYG